MSKKAKSASIERRKKEKRARKEAQRAKYKAFAEAGNNSKRSVLKRKRKKMVRTIKHRMGPCHNTGCKRCFPETVTIPRRKWTTSKKKRVLAQKTQT